MAGERVGERDTWRSGTRDFGIINGSDSANGRFRVFQFRGVRCIPLQASTRHSYRGNDGRLPYLSPSAPPLLRVMIVTYRGMKSLRQFPHRDRTGYNIIHGFREIKCKFSLYRYFRPSGRRFYVLCTVILLCNILPANSYSTFLQYALQKCVGRWTKQKLV